MRGAINRQHNCQHDHSTTSAPGHPPHPYIKSWSLRWLASAIICSAVRAPLAVGVVRPMAGMEWRCKMVLVLRDGELEAARLGGPLVVGAATDAPSPTGSSGAGRRRSSSDRRGEDCGEEASTGLCSRICEANETRRRPAAAAAVSAAEGTPPAVADASAVDAISDTAVMGEARGTRTASVDGST